MFVISGMLCTKSQGNITSTSSAKVELLDQAVYVSQDSTGAKTVTVKCLPPAPQDRAFLSQGTRSSIQKSNLSQRG